MLNFLSTILDVSKVELIQVGDVLIQWGLMLLKFTGVAIIIVPIAFFIIKYLSKIVKELDIKMV